MAKRTENIRFLLDLQLGRPYSRQENSAVNMHIFTNARKQDPGSEFFHPGSRVTRIRFLDPDLHQRI
jgi:hypothetical protein